MTSECTSGKGKWMNATGLRAVWMHDHYFFFMQECFWDLGSYLTRRVMSLIDLYLATGGIGQLKIHENEKTSFSGNRWTKGNLPTSSSVNPTAQLIHVVDGVSLAQTSKEVRFEVWSWWMEKNRQIASRTDKGSSTGLMIVREHLGTLLIAGEREREKWIHYRKQLLLSSNRVSCFTRVEVSVSTYLLIRSMRSWKCNEMAPAQIMLRLCADSKGLSAQLWEINQQRACG